MTVKNKDVGKGYGDLIDDNYGDSVSQDAIDDMDNSIVTVMVTVKFIE